MDMKKIGFAFVAIAAVMFGAGCIDSGPVPTPIGTPEPTQGPAPEPTFRRSTQIPQPEHNDDALFAQLVQEMGVDVGRYSGDLATSLSNYDLIEAHIVAQRLESLASVYMEEANEYVLTDEMEKTRSLVLAFLDEVWLSAVATQAGIPRDGALKDVDSDKLEEAGVHVEKAMVYWDMVGESDE